MLRDVILSLIHKPNGWYDSLPEPRRCLTFFIPFISGTVLVSFLGPIYTAAWMGVLVLFSLYRWSYFILPSAEDIHRITSTGKIIHGIESTKNMDFPYPPEPPDEDEPQVKQDLERLVIDPSFSLMSSYHDAGSCWELIDAAVVEIRRTRTIINGLTKGMPLGPISGAATILEQEIEIKKLRAQVETLHKRLGSVSIDTEQRG